MKNIIAASAALIFIMGPGGLLAQTKIRVDNPSVTAGDVDSKSKSQASQTVTGLDATVVFEAAEIPTSTSTRARVKNVPDVAAPSIVGGNPCMVSASVGGSFVGGGFGVGIGLEDEGCETRQVTALISNMGDRQAAYYHLCLHNEDFAETVKGMGFSSCADYAGVIVSGAAREPAPGLVYGTQPGRTAQGAVIPVSSNGRTTSTHAGLPAPAPVPAARAESCSDSEYRQLLSTGAAWSSYSPACQARHANG